jgi:hypothetical protein
MHLGCGKSLNRIAAYFPYPTLFTAKSLTSLRNTTPHIFLPIPVASATSRGLTETPAPRTAFKIIRRTSSIFPALQKTPPSLSLTLSLSVAQEYIFLSIYIDSEGNVERE